MYTEVSKTCLGTLATRAANGYKMEKHFYEYLKHRSLLEGFTGYQFKPVLERTRIYDELIKKEIEKKPDIKILNIGCGFCGRFFRLNNSKITWVDFDNEFIVKLRKDALSRPIPRNYHLAEGDLRAGLEDGFDLYVAEGVFMYVKEDIIKANIKPHMLFDVIGMARTVPLGPDQLWKYNEEEWKQLNIIEKYEFDSKKRASIILHVLQS